MTLCAVFTVLAGAGVTEANGRFPQAQHAVLGPGRGDDLLAVRTTFGLVVSDDGAQRFRFLCEEAFQYRDGFDPAIAWTATGALLVGVEDGLQSTRDLCDPSRVRDLEGQSVLDLATDPAGRVVIAALLSRDAVPVTRFARSDDAGATFEVLPERLSPMAPLTVEVAPSDARRLYATAIADPVGDPAPAFLRSDDGGRTWRRTRAVFPGLADVFVSGVDPSRPDVVWARARPRALDLDAGAADSGAVLLRSDDGGEGFREVARTAGPMRGFALSGDGARAWLGGPDRRDGLQRSDDGGMTWRRVADVAVDCLRWHAGALYLCEALAPGAALLARSRDDGATREALARVEDVLPPPQGCAQSSVVRGFCTERWAALRPMVLSRLTDGGAADAAGGDAARDAARDAGGGGGTPSCGDCAVGARATGGGWAAVAAGLAALAGRRRGRGRP